MADEDPPPFADAPELRGYVMLVARNLWHNAGGFGVGGILTHIEPPEGMTFPFRLERVIVYAQLWGDPGEYVFRVRLVRIERTGYDEEVESEADVGTPWETPLVTPRPLEVTGLNYLDEIAFPIFRVPVPETGVYEFQLWAEGIDQPVAFARVHARP
jgi:hypothetical protein